MSKRLSPCRFFPARSVMPCRPVWRSSAGVGTRRIVASLALTILSVQAAPARAADLFASGDQARALCVDSPEWCTGFVTGALDGWAALESYYSGEKFCLPGDLPVGQIVETFRQELDRQAEPRDDPAAYVLYEGLIALFPCGAASGAEPPDPAVP